jgi:hypothetical protein
MPLARDEAKKPASAGEEESWEMVSQPRSLAGAE